MLKGKIFDSEGNHTIFIGKRYPKWDFLPNLAVFGKNQKTRNIEPIEEYGRLSACAMITKPIKDVKEIILTPLKSFKAQSTYWLTAPNQPY